MLFLFVHMMFTSIAHIKINNRIRNESVDTLNYIFSATKNTTFLRISPKILNEGCMFADSKMPPKSNNQKKAEAAAAGKAPKKTKQQENAGKSASQKKAELKEKRAAKTSDGPKYM